MSNLGIKVNIIETIDQISNSIVKALYPEIKSYFDRVSNNLSSRISNIIIDSIRSQPEYEALINGSLQYEFGIINPQEKLQQILETIRSGIYIQYDAPSISGNKIKGKFKLEMIRSDFADLLSIGAASFETEKGVQINWLEWLLLQGDTVIVSDYYFVFGPFQSSRTGGGIMRSKTGSSWRVPPEFAGNIKNNWITRAIDAVGGDISSLLEQSISKG